MAKTPRRPNQKPPEVAGARRAAAARQGTSVGTSGRAGGSGARGGSDRNRYLLYGGIGVVILVIAIVAAAQAFSGGGKKDVSKIGTTAAGSTATSTSGSDAGAAVVAGKATVDGLIGGIAQSGNTLGQASAPVTVIEYVDLLCPACAAYSQSGFNDIVNNYVRPGKVKIQFEYYPVIWLNNKNPSDEVAVGAFEAAKKQNKLFDLALLWWRNQGDEGDDYADPGYVDAIAQAAGLDLNAFDAARKTVDGKSYITKSASTGGKIGLTLTPSAFVVDRSGKRSGPMTVDRAPAAIDAALKS
jgi:protein-disulfide isomerase